MDAGSALSAYFLATEKRRKAEAEYGAASARLEHAFVQERAAEVESQHEPIASLMDSMGTWKIEDKEHVRELMLKLVRYVTYGRKIE